MYKHVFAIMYVKKYIVIEMKKQDNLKYARFSLNVKILNFPVLFSILFCHGEEGKGN